MRGVAPGKKTSGLQQKNVEVKTKKYKQKTPGNGDGGSTSETPQSPRKKRARVASTVENEETFMYRVEVKVKIPEELKPWLVEDWDLITWQKQLFYLPAKKNADSILEDSANYKQSRGNTENKEYAVHEVVAGIKEYFNVTLGTSCSVNMRDHSMLKPSQITLMHHVPGARSATSTEIICTYWSDVGLCTSG